MLELCDVAKKPRRNNGCVELYITLYMTSSGCQCQTHAPEKVRVVPIQRESRHHRSICAISPMSAARSALTSPLVGDWDIFATRSPRLTLGVDLDDVMMLWYDINIKYSCFAADYLCGDGAQFWDEIL